MKKQILFIFLSLAFIYACNNSDNAMTNPATDSVMIKHNTDATHPDTTLGQKQPLTDSGK